MAAAARAALARPEVRAKRAATIVRSAVRRARAHLVALEARARGEVGRPAPVEVLAAPSGFARLEDA